VQDYSGQWLRAEKGMVAGTGTGKRREELGQKSVLVGVVARW